MDIVIDTSALIAVIVAEPEKDQIIKVPTVTMEEGMQVSNIGDG